MFSLLKDIDEYTIFSDIDYIKRDNKNVYLGLRIGEDIKPIKLTLEAFKVYGFLCFSVAFDCESINDDELSCQMSNKVIVEACLRHSNPCVSDSSLKKLVIAAINELVKLRLIEKIANQSNGHYQANSYRLCPKSEWLKNLTATKTISKPCGDDITANERVVRNNYYQVWTTPLESENLTAHGIDIDLGVVQKSTNRNSGDLLSVSSVNKNWTTPKMNSNHCTESVTDDKRVVQNNYYEIITTSVTPEPVALYSVEYDLGVVQNSSEETGTTLSTPETYTVYSVEPDLGVVQDFLTINNGFSTISKKRTTPKTDSNPYTVIDSSDKRVVQISSDEIITTNKEAKTVDISEPETDLNVSQVEIVPTTLKEGELLVRCLVTKEEWVTELKNTRKMGDKKPNNKTETVAKVIDSLDSNSVNDILIVYKKGCEPVELTTSEKMGALLQIFTNRVKMPENDYAEGDTANEDEKKAEILRYNNNINFINNNINNNNINNNFNINQENNTKIQDLDLPENNYPDIYIEHKKNNIYNLTSAHTHAHTHTREDESQEEMEEDGQGKIETEIKPPEPEKPKNRRRYLNASDISSLTVLFNEHKPKHWFPFKVAPHQRRQLESYLHDLNYQETGIDGLFKDIVDALEWVKVQSYWERNKGGLHSLLYRDNFMLWSQMYQEHKKPVLNSTLDTANRMNGYDHQTYQTKNNSVLCLPAPVPVPEPLPERTPEEIERIKAKIEEAKQKRIQLEKENEEKRKAKREYQWYLERKKAFEELNGKTEYKHKENKTKTDENQDKQKSA